MFSALPVGLRSLRLYITWLPTTNRESVAKTNTVQIASMCSSDHDKHRFVCLFDYTKYEFWLGL